MSRYNPFSDDSNSSCHSTPTTAGSTQINRTAVICVAAGDTINIGLAQSSTNPVSLIDAGSSTTVSTPSSTLTFTQLN